MALQRQARDADIVVMSYETLRSDVAWASARPWLYAVLDEGHTVRNSKSQTAQASPHHQCICCCLMHTGFDSAAAQP